MDLKVSDFKLGDRVIYDGNKPKYGYGTVERLNENYVFVLYDGGNFSMATHPSNLKLMLPNNNSWAPNPSSRVAKPSVLSKPKPNKLQTLDDNPNYFNKDEMRHLAVNYAITCMNGYKGSFEDWYDTISPTWRDIANQKKKK